MSTFETGRVPPVVAGEHSLQHIGLRAAALGSRTIVVVVDEGVVAAGYEHRVTASLPSGPAVRRVVLPAGEPAAATVDELASSLRTVVDPLIVGVGGGSTLDTAKQAAAAAVGSAGIAHYALSAHRLPGRLPLIAVPTTAGTGAEVTRTCIHTDAVGRKVWTWGDELLPDLVLLDPMATASLPAHLSAATGLDAFVHALEAVSGQTIVGIRRGAGGARPAAGRRAPRRGRRRRCGPRWTRQRCSTPHCLPEWRSTTAAPASPTRSAMRSAPLPTSRTGWRWPSALPPRSTGTSPEPPMPIRLRHERSVSRSGELPDRYEALLAEVGFAAALARLPAPTIGVDQIAEAMVAEENQPMFAQQRPAGRRRRARPARRAHPRSAGTS